MRLIVVIVYLLLLFMTITAWSSHNKKVAELERNTPTGDLDQFNFDYWGSGKLLIILAIETVVLFLFMKSEGTL